jgi:hypothetical protein
MGSNVPSSKGTTTKDSVAPADAPVRIDKLWFIFSTPKVFRQNLPHSSLAANLVALLGASMRIGAVMPLYSLEALSSQISIYPSFALDLAAYPS